jgi:hypothetical protein
MLELWLDAGFLFPAKKKMQAFYNSFGLEILVIIDGELIKLTYNLG